MGTAISSTKAATRPAAYSPILARLGDLCETSTGGTPSRGNSDLFRGTTPWVKSGELPDGLVTTTEERISDEAFSRCNVSLLPKGTLLMAMYGATVGKLGILGMPAATNQAVCAITPNPSLDRNYLFYWLLSIRQELIANSFGGAQPNISQSVVRNISVPLVPTHEQRRIAATLHDQLAAVAEARAAVQAQFDAARTLPAAYLRAVFNSPAATRWPKRHIGEVAKIQSGYAFKSEWFAGDGIRLLRNANVSQDRIDWTETARLPATRRAEFPAYELSEGDIILSLDRPVVSGGLKVARVSSADLPALLLQRVGRFQLKESIQADYLYHFLHTQDFIGEITAHDQSLGVPHVSPKQVEQVQLPVPSMAEQCTIAARIEAELGDASALAAHLSARLTALDHLPSALLREAFAGRV
jgi:type I restriction enzyme S subunit